MFDPGIHLEEIKTELKESKITTKRSIIWMPALTSVRVEVFHTLVDIETLNRLLRCESSLDYKSGTIMRVLLGMDDAPDRTEATQMCAAGSIDNVLDCR